MNEDALNIHQDYLKRRIDEIRNRLGVLEEKTSSLMLDERGDAVGEPTESEYYSSAKKSSDLFNKYLLENQIKEFTTENKKLDERKRIVRKNISEATSCLNEDKKYLDLIDRELKRLDIEFLSANEENSPAIVAELEKYRAEKSSTLNRINKFYAEIQTFNEEISDIVHNEKMNKELLATLRSELSLVKNRKESEYINIDQYKKDIKELEELRKVLPGLEIFLAQYMESNVEKIAKQLNEKMEKVSEPAKEAAPLSVPIAPVVETPVVDSSPVLDGEPAGVPPMPNSEAMPAPEVPTPTAEEPKPTEDMDGFKLDFLEKFGYLPGEAEYKMNPNYKDGAPLVAAVPAAEMPPVTPPSTPAPAPTAEEPKPIWQMNGFQLDFLEKFGYLPGEAEYKMNPNYKEGAPLVCGEEAQAYRDNTAEVEAKEKRQFIPDRVRRVVKTIRHPIKSVKAWGKQKIQEIKDNHQEKKSFKAREKENQARLEAKMSIR